MCLPSHVFMCEFPLYIKSWKYLWLFQKTLESICLATTNGKIKVNFSLCFSLAQRHEGILGALEV